MASPTSFEQYSVEVDDYETISTEELYSWAVPTGEELEKCASAWVSGGTLVAEQEVEESPEQVQAKKTWVQVHFPSFNMHSDNCNLSHLTVLLLSWIAE